MHRVLALYGTPEDPQAFKDYYVSTHLPLASRLPGMRSMRYSFDLSTPDGPAPYFAVFEAEFDSAEAFGAAVSSPEGQKVLADIPNYATGGLTIMDYPLLGTESTQAKPQVIGAHEIELQPGTDEGEYERLALTTMAQPAPDGVTVRLFKGDRGARNGKYLMTLEMDTVANRDTTFPTEGSHDDSPAIQAWQQENPAAAEAWGRLSEYGGTTEVFTDYVAIDH